MAVFNNAQARGCVAGGIAFANSYGGWTFGQHQLEELAERGPKHVSAFQATAWFPAAAQGQVTINFGLKIPARTFSTEGLCYFHALKHARRMLKSGVCQHMFVGSAETFGTAWLRSSLNRDPAEDCATWLLVQSEDDEPGEEAIALRYLDLSPASEEIARDLAQPDGSSCALPIAIERVRIGGPPVEIAGLWVVRDQDRVVVSPQGRMP